MGKNLGDLMLGEITIGDLVDLAAERYTKREVLVFNKERITFEELRTRVNTLASAFLKIGLRKGDKIAIWLSNRPEYIYTFLAAAKIGATLVPLNTRYKLTEFKDTVFRSDATTLITGDYFLNIGFIDMVNEIVPELKESKPGLLQAKEFPNLKNVIVVSEQQYPGTFQFSSLLNAAVSDLGEELKKVQRATVPEDIAVLMFTAGTTGLPKGVMLTHHMTTHHFLCGERKGITETDRSLLFLPLCHIFGLASCFLDYFSHGACTILQEYFDPGEALRIMAEEKITVIGCVPTNMIMILNHPDFPKYQSQLCLRTGLIGGAPVPEKLLKDIHEKIGAKGLTHGYGQTECCGITSMSVPGQKLELTASSIGRPMSDYEVKVVNPLTGETLPPNREGELVVRGKACMRGYYKMEQETAATMDKEGWIRSGDLVRMDEDHNLYFTGRVKEIFQVGGENVAPAEVENFIFGNPKVKNVQIVGVPDQRLGEVPAAFIQLKEGESCTEEEIIDFCKGKIANYKVPRYVMFVKDYPLTASGKIQKFKLREQAIKRWNLDRELT